MARQPTQIRPRARFTQTRSLTCQLKTQSWWQSANAVLAKRECRPRRLTGTPRPAQVSALLPAESVAHGVSAGARGRAESLWLAHGRGWLASVSPLRQVCRRARGWRSGRAPSAHHRRVTVRSRCSKQLPGVAYTHSLASSCAAASSLGSCTTFRLTLATRKAWTAILRHGA